MKIIGQTLTDAYQEWIKDEIKSTTAQIFDFGKFIFGVSAGTIGFITTIEKYTSGKPDIFYFSSLILLIISSVLAITIILPKNLNVEPDSDLTVLFATRVKKYKRIIWIWFIIWLISICFGFYGFFV
jgi:hypothetical protein